MNTEVQQKNFKVVRILDEYRIVVNAGIKDGVSSKTTYFDITGALDEIYDPETQELLGTIDGVKASVYPSDIYEKMCICKAQRVFTPMDLSPTLGLLEQALMGKPEKLPVDKSQISNPEAYTPIVIGDTAVMRERTKRLSSPEEKHS
nr:MAG TPA: hypothetical protein [Caudoviricetes sp.]